MVHGLWTSKLLAGMYLLKCKFLGSFEFLHLHFYQHSYVILNAVWSIRVLSLETVISFYKRWSSVVLRVTCCRITKKYYASWKQHNERAWVWNQTDLYSNYTCATYSLVLDKILNLVTLCFSDKSVDEKIYFLGLFQGLNKITEHSRYSMNLTSLIPY